MSTPSNLKYSYSWAKGPVNMFVEKYARGTYFLAKMLGISAGELRHGLVLILASGNSLKFEALKRAIKVFDRDGEYKISHWSDKDKKLLYKWYLKMSIYDEIDSKDDRDILDKAQNQDLLF